MKKTTIEIEVRVAGARTRETVEAYDFYPFAVHVAFGFRGASPSHRRRWAITHVPSGLAVSTNWSFCVAVLVDRSLARTRFWLTTEPSKWNASEREHAKNLRDLALAEVGL